MIQAVIFDMFETLISHYTCPVYFGAEMAIDAGIPAEAFIAEWRAEERDRSLGKLSFEDSIRTILRKNGRDSEEVCRQIAHKRRQTKKMCFETMHPDVLPMLQALKREGIRIGLISNCFSEEAEVIRESVLFPYFDVVCLSCEEGCCKPDPAIYATCLNRLGLQPHECLYVGDGGSMELEAAKEAGMHTVQATWYLKEGTMQPSGRKKGWVQADTPMQIMDLRTDLAASVYVAPGAVVLGNVTIREQSSVWFHATIRGDADRIRIGEASNVQDNCVLHADAGYPVVIGDRVIIGHGAIVHGCTIGDGTLVGMGSILLNGSRIGKNCIIGAGALVTGGTVIPDGSVVMGNPARICRPIRPEEVQHNAENADYYVKEAQERLHFMPEDSGSV